MKIGIVTTFSDAGFDQYGKHFVESCNKFLHKDITVYVYIDNILLEKYNNFVIRNLEKSIPELTNFKKRNSHKIPTNFINDAVRFSHKSYCIYHVANNTDVDLLFWLDSDTEIYNNLDSKFFENLLPIDYFSSYLGRSNYTETGFVGFNLTHQYAKEYFEKFKWYYDTDKIYDLDGQLDCHVYDAARICLENEQKIKNLNLSPPGLLKNHFNHVFDGYLIHYKGDRKNNRNAQLSKATKRNNKNGTT